MDANITIFQSAAEQYPEWLKPLAFGSAYGKDKVERLKRSFELDDKFTDWKLNILNGWHIPRSYTEKEFPEYKSMFDHYEKHRPSPTFNVGSCVEGTWICQALKNPRCCYETDVLIVKQTLTDEKCGKLGRHSRQPGWYWLDTSISYAMIADKKSVNSGYLYRRDFDVGAQSVISEVGPSVADEITYTHAQLGTKVMISRDSVVAVQLDFWPSEAWEWVHRSRKWPQVPLVVDITQTPCFLVHKPFTLNDPYANEWYISFTLAEKMIARKRSEGMKMTYFVFKAIYNCSFKYTSQDKEFGSYLVKTIMMWACEEYPIHQWTPDNLDANIRILLEKLLGYIDKRFLPHYFIPELNLLSRLPESLFTMMEEDLDRDRLLNDPMSFIPDDLLDDIILAQFATYRCSRMDIRIRTEIANVMGWETFVDANYDCDVIHSITGTCFRNICIIIEEGIPFPMALLRDPDDLIELLRSQMNDEALRQEIKKELEHINTQPCFCCR